MECQTTTIETETLLGLLSDHQRRQVVETLVDHPENVVPVDFLADRVTRGPSADGANPRQSEGLVALKHRHLPRLADAGLVDYDWTSEVVRYHPNERVEALLEFVTTELE